MNHSYATRYDQDGNLRRQVIGEEKVFSFAYDAENHLVEISGDDAATFVYDADGQRVKASFGNAPNVTTVVYVVHTRSCQLL